LAFQSQYLQRFSSKSQTCAGRQKFELPNTHGPSWVWTKCILVYDHSHTANKCPFYSLFTATVLQFCAFVVKLLLKIASKHRTKVLSGIFKYKRLWCATWRKWMC
jgi:hypothetical protein